MAEDYAAGLRRAEARLSPEERAALQIPGGLPALRKGGQKALKRLIKKRKKAGMPVSPVTAAPASKINISVLAKSVIDNISSFAKAPGVRVSEWKWAATYMKKNVEGSVATGLLSDTIRAMGRSGGEKLDIGPQLPLAKVGHKSLGRFIVEDIITEPLALMLDIPARALGAQRLEGKNVRPIDLFLRATEFQAEGRRIAKEQLGRKLTSEEREERMEAEKMVGLPLAVIALFQFTEVPEKVAGRVATPILQKVARGPLGKLLKPVVKLVKGAPKRAFTVIDDIVKGFQKGTQPLAQRLLGRFGKVSVETSAQFFKRQFVDRFAPLEELTKRAIKKLPFELDFYKGARLYASAHRAYQNLVENTLSPVLRREAHRLDDLSTLLYLNRAKEVAKHGKKVLSPDDIAKGLGELRVKLGREGMETLKRSADDVAKFGRGLLKMMRDSDLISHGDYTRMAKAGEHWVPLEVIADATDDLIAGKFAHKSLNVSSTKRILAALKGGEDFVRRNPLEALAKRGLDVFAFAEKNKILVNLYRFSEANPDLGLTVVKSTDAAKRLGMGTISFFVDGKKMLLAVDKPIEIAIKNLDEVSFGVMHGAANLSARVLRAGATAFNIAFMPVNIVRDMGNAMLTKATTGGSKTLAQWVAYYPQALYEIAIRGEKGRHLLGKQIIAPSKAYNLWLKSGGGWATITSQIFRNPEGFIKTIAGKRGVIRTALSSPKDLLRFVSSVGEESTRFTEFLFQRGKGVIPREAAFLSRDITVDFARSGSSMRALNSVIPFINANLQGMLRVGTIAKDNPVNFVKYMGIMGGTPSLMMYMHNRTLKDYADIPSWEKQGNWILLARDRTEEERRANAPLIGIKIPKPHYFMPFTALFEGWLEFADGKNKKPLDVLADAIENVSPVGLPIIGGEERTLRSLGTILPPGAEALAQLFGMMEKEPYTGRRIIPMGLEGVAKEEQFTERTPELYVRLGKLLKMSPARLEAAAKSQFAGLGSMLAKLVSAPLEETLPQEEPTTPLGRLREKPIVGDIAKRFFGVTPAGEEEREGERIGEALTESKTRLLRERREAKKIWLEIKPLPSSGRRKRLSELKREGILTEELYDRIVEYIREDKLGITPMDKLLKTVSPKERAELIAEDLEKFEDRREWIEYLRELKAKGILTRSTYEELEKIVGKIL